MWTKLLISFTCLGGGSDFGPFIKAFVFLYALICATNMYFLDILSMFLCVFVFLSKLAVSFSFTFDNIGSLILLDCSDDYCKEQLESSLE